MDICLPSIHFPFFLLLFHWHPPFHTVGAWVYGTPSKAPRVSLCSNMWLRPDKLQQLFLLVTVTGRVMSMTKVTVIILNVWAARDATENSPLSPDLEGYENITAVATLPGTILRSPSMIYCYCLSLRPHSSLIKKVQFWIMRCICHVCEVPISAEQFLSFSLTFLTSNLLKIIGQSPLEFSSTWVFLIFPHSWI